MPHGTPMVCQWVPIGSVMGYPWGIGITKRFPNTRSIRMFPDTRSLGIFRHIPLTIGISELEIPNTRGIRIFKHIPQQLVFPKGKYQIPGVFVYSGTYPNNWYFRGPPNTRSIRIFRHIPQQLIFPRKYQIPAVFFIFRRIPKQFVFPRGNTKYLQYSYIQA